MSKLEELIKEFCPNGVEYKNFYSVCKYVRGITYSSVQELFNPIDGTPVLRANNIDLQTNTLILEDIKFVDESVKIKEEQWLKKDDILICAGSGSKEHIGKIAYIFKNVNMTFGGFMGVIRANRDVLLSRFLFHFLTSNMFKRHLSKVSASNSSTINNINNETWRNLQIPLPALPVQREIVRILDSFTLYSAELTAELTARRKQYEFYRDKLLNFNQQEVEIKKLSDIFDTRNGYTPSTSNKEYWATNDIPWFRVEDIRANGRILNDSIQHVSFSAIKGKVFPANSIIISTSATIGEHALITCESIANQRFTYLMLKDQYKDKYNIKYLFYYCFLLADFCRENLQQGSFASVDMSKFNKFEFPIPPMEVQERIVKVLDNFDAICSDLGIGLPAEIEKRQKQYEYYREKLLTFDGKYATILTERNGTERNGQG